METGYRLDDRGSILGRGELFLYITSSRPALGPTQPPIQWVPEALSPGGVKPPKGEAEHSPPSSVDVKNDGAIPPLTHMPS
jgi:hypothetical protein